MSEKKEIKQEELEKVSGGDYFDSLWEKAKKVIKEVTDETVNKNELNQEDLEKVSGGVSIGNERIVQCNECGANYNPDSATKGTPIEMVDENDVHWLYNRFICPCCGKEATFKVIQVLESDLKIKF